MKILNFGSMNHDYVYRVPHFVQPGETLSVETMQCFPGGKGLNQSIATARAGQLVYHAGCWGEGGESLKKTLEAEGVQTEYLKPAGVFQGQALIQVDAAGENCILVYGGSNRALTKAAVEAVLSQFDADTYVLLQNETNCVADILSGASKRGMKIIFNPAPFQKEVLKMDLSVVHWLVINEVEGAGITGKTEAAEIVAALKSACPNTGILYTCGADGVICSSAEDNLVHGIYKVPVVDTTAAGDTFIGYFAAGLAAERPMEEILKTASIASALCVSKAGASVSIPTMQQVKHADLAYIPSKYQ